jgi:phosphoribosylaminoimidazolecarboxamide formyltransferase / IMP cyclohydrolase
LGQSVRLLRTGDLPPPSQWQGAFTPRGLTGSMLYTERDAIDLNPEQLQVVTDRSPTAEEWRDLRFAWKVVKHVKSNAIVVARAEQVLGVGAGQMNRVGAVRLALEQAGEQAAGAALASDAFFPFPDSIEMAASAGIRALSSPAAPKRTPK